MNYMNYMDEQTTATAKIKLEFLSMSISCISTVFMYFFLVFPSKKSQDMTSFNKNKKHLFQFLILVIVIFTFISTFVIEDYPYYLLFPLSDYNLSNTNINNYLFSGFVSIFMSVIISDRLSLFINEICLHIISFNNDEQNQDDKNSYFYIALEITSQACISCLISICVSTLVLK